MDFVIGLIVGLFFGGGIGLAIASLMANSREQEIIEKLNGDPDGSKAVLDETIATLKKQSRTKKDSDTWESDMNRDAEQYKAGE